jgi:hypothetical protein
LRPRRRVREKEKIRAFLALVYDVGGRCDAELAEAGRIRAISSSVSLQCSNELLTLGADLPAARIIACGPE